MIWNQQCSKKFSISYKQKKDESRNGLGGYLGFRYVLAYC